MVAAARTPIRLSSQDVTRLVVVLVGLSLVIAAFTLPWWTRGMTLSEDGAAGMEGQYFNYGPFQTPSQGGFSTDGSREAAVGVLGVAVALATLLVLGAFVLRAAMRWDRVERNHDRPVRLAIGAFWIGLFAILWAGLVLPAAGTNPGFLYGEEGGSDPDMAQAMADAGVTMTRYANVGFFAGILAFAGLPAYAWLDAARTRALQAAPLPGASDAAPST